ncbi:MAG: glycosyltransferase [Candidatus Omnitrophota bacterium]
MLSDKPKLLIFIVAYNAEGMIDAVLGRIPEAVYDSYRPHILIIDDSSQDHTFEAGLSFSRISPHHNITVLRNPENQGYGGNQKIGYNYAIREGYDIVVMLHGDGQYAPEYMPDIVGPIAAGRADAVFGSRMLKRGGALKGGMPLYKYVGNKILTFAQNRLMGVCLSEWHSGYRAYRVGALRQIPFERNDNGFAFDTDIILQLMQHRAHILEVPVPTYYGSEICRVNGLRYAYEIVRNVVLCRLHNMNLIYERKYDCCPRGEQYALKLGYASSHSLAIEMVKAGSWVLDIGCGQGLVAAELKKKGCRVVGVDRQRPKNVAPFEAFFLANLPAKERPWDKPYLFDYVLLLDVVEHMPDPEDFLDRLRVWLQGHPCALIITSANIAYLLPRLQLLFGRFNYVKRGILDMTHLRLFTFSALGKILSQSGYDVLGLRGIPAPFPEVVRPKGLALFLVAVNRLLIKLCKSLFSYQILFVARPRVNLDFLLLRSFRHSRERKREVG